MRLLHVADVHLERAFGWLGRQRGDRRRGELRQTLTRAVDLAIESKVDALCIAGDLYETEKVNDATGQFLRDLFSRVSIPVLISPGNHDPFHPGCLYDRVAWSDNVHIFRESELTSVRVMDGWIWGRAFRGPEDHGAPLAGFRVPDDDLHLGLVHADVVDPGQTSKFAPLDTTAIATSGLGHVMLGHIHAGRHDPTCRYAYSGSIEPLDSSENGTHVAYIVDATPSGVRVEQLQVARRRVVAEDIDVSETVSIDEFRQLVESKRLGWEGNDIQLRLHGRLMGELALRPEGINEALTSFDVKLELAARPPIDEDVLATQKTTLGAFVRAMRELIDRAANDVERRRHADILEAGVAAFSGREVSFG